VRSGVPSRVLWTLLACSGGAPPPPNVLVIVVDTLRADHVGVGHTPHLDALASRGWSASDAHATSPWTLPSIASLLTGRYPAAHGLERIQQDLGADVTLLSERFQHAGYRTCGVVSNLLLRREGLARGFDVWDSSQAGPDYLVTGEAVAERATACMAGGDPWFAFVHLFDPHYRYPPASRGDAPEQAGRLTGMEDVNHVRHGLAPLSDEERAFLAARYAAEVAYTDRAVGTLVRAAGPDTLVAVTADHGEELLERGWFGHTVHVHDELTRVPWILAGPGVEHEVHADPVSNVALPADVLELAGLGAPEGWEDRSSPVVVDLDYKPLAGDAVAAEHEDVGALAAVTSRWRLIVDDRRGTTQLFDRVQDPGERRDVAGAHQDVVSQLTRQLAAYDRQGTAEPVELPVEALDVEALRALGYVD